MKKLILLSLALYSVTVHHAWADINIAVIGPMTGKYAAFGAQMRNGAELAVADLNAQGGFNGEKVKLVIGDDACDPEQAVSVAYSMASRGIQFVAGHFCSGASISASKVYESEGIIQISPASTSPKFTDEGGLNVFRVGGRDDDQGRTAGAFFKKHYANKKIAIIHDDTVYGKGLAAETEKSFKTNGLIPSFKEIIKPGSSDFSKIVSRLKTEKIDAVFFGGYHTEAALLVRQIRESGLKTVLMGGDALMTQEFSKMAGKACEGTLMTFSPDPRAKPVAARVVRKLRERNIEPEGYVLYTYGAIEAWAKAAKKANSVTPVKVLKELHKNSFRTVLGRLSFTKNGDVKDNGYVVYRWDSKGGYTYY